MSPTPEMDSVHSTEAPVPSVVSVHWHAESVSKRSHTWSTDDGSGRAGGAIEESGRAGGAIEESGDEGVVDGLDESPPLSPPSVGGEVVEGQGELLQIVPQRYA